MSQELATRPGLFDKAAETSAPEGVRALVDLRSGAMSLPSEQIQAGLAEYSARRESIRDWLRKQLVEGVHYGYPPGCEPKIDDRGWYGVWTKGRDGERGGYKYFPPEQWSPKPSFYKAGADFVVDLMGIRCEYEADLAAWKQIGEPKDTFVMTCRGISRTTGEVIGEGRGVRKVGTKGGDANNAIKMAQKSAKVAMILDAYGLADLFTQDMEDIPQPDPVDPPQHDADAPNATPRGERVTAADVTEIVNGWKHRVALDANDKAACRSWISEYTGIDHDKALDPNHWTRADLEKCRAQLDKVPF